MANPLKTRDRFALFAHTIYEFETTMSAFIQTLTLVLLLALSNSLEAGTLEAFTEPFRQVDLAAGDSGIIAEVHVQPGDVVREGEVLVSLDNRVFEATLAVAKQKAASEGSLGIAKAELQLQKERLSQVLQLRGRGHATQRELSRAKTDVAVAEARFRHAEDEQRLSELDCRRIEAQIAQRQVISPFAGVVIDLRRKAGEPTLVTDPSVATLAQLNRLRARFSATPGQVASLRKNQKLNLILAETNERIPATVERIAKTIDAKSGTLELHVIIDNANHLLRSGSRCLLDVEDGIGSANSLAAPQPNKTRYVGGNR